MLTDNNHTLELRKKILDQKDDLIPNTFCFLLFEKSFFDKEKLDELIENIETYQSSTPKDIEMNTTIEWIYNCINQCLISDKDPDDYYKILNMSPDIEVKWKEVWMLKLRNQIGLISENKCDTHGIA